MTKIKYFFRKEFTIEFLLFKYFNIECFTNRTFKYSNCIYLFNIINFPYRSNENKI